MRVKKSRWTGPRAHVIRGEAFAGARAQRAVEGSRADEELRERQARTAATRAIAATTVPVNRSVSAQRTAAASSPPRDGVFFFIFFH